MTVRLPIARAGESPVRASAGIFPAIFLRDRCDGAVFLSCATASRSTRHIASPPRGRRHARYHRRFHAEAAQAMGHHAHIWLSRRRHQRHHGRVRAHRRRACLRAGAPRRNGRVHGLRAREVHRAGRRVPRDLGTGCDPSAERSLRREARPSAGGGHRRPAAVARARRPLSAGGRSRVAVQGRGQRLRANGLQPRADAPRRRSRGAHRLCDAHGDLHHRAQRRAGDAGGGKATARARHDPLGHRLQRAARHPRRRRPRPRRGGAQSRQAGRDAGRRGRDGRDRRGDRGRGAARRGRREGLARQGRGAGRAGLRHGPHRPARQQAELRHDERMRRC